MFHRLEQGGPASLNHPRTWGETSPSSCSPVDSLSSALCTAAERRNSATTLGQPRWMLVAGCAFVVTQSNREQNRASLENAYSSDEVNMFFFNCTAMDECCGPPECQQPAAKRFSGARVFPGKASLYVQSHCLLWLSKQELNPQIVFLVWFRAAKIPFAAPVLPRGSTECPRRSEDAAEFIGVITPAIIAGEVFPWGEEMWSSHSGADFHL